MILYVRYENGKLNMLDPYKGDDIDPIGYSHRAENYNNKPGWWSEYYIDTDRIERSMFSYDHPQAYEDVKKYMKIHNRSETINKILNEQKISISSS